jgi:hypothetical protein
MGNRLPDPRLVAAIVDRVTFNAHILETGTRSYRLATSKPAPAAPSPANDVPGIVGVVDRYRLSSRRGPGQPRPACRATAVAYRQLGMMPGCTFGEYGSAHGRGGPGDDAAVRGPACGGCGHVDRLIT